MFLLTLASGISNLVGIGFLVVAVLVIATVGRRHRPDAYGWILAWAVGNLVWWPIAMLLQFTVPRFASGLNDVQTMMGVQTLLSTIVHAALWLVFLRGFVKLAQPPRAVSAEPTGPYR